MKRFLVIDDHSIVRTGISMLIRQAYTLAVIDVAASGDSGYKMILASDYDLVILDIHMPETDSTTLVEMMLTIRPHLRILLFTMGAEHIFAKRFLKMGVKGFLSKESPDEEIERAIDIVLNGRRYITENLFQSMADDSLNAKSHNPFDQLSSREFEIAIHLIKGKSVGEISQTLSIQNSTVATHKARLLEKLQVRNAMELKDLAQLYHIAF